MFKLKSVRIFLIEVGKLSVFIEKLNSSLALLDGKLCLNNVRISVVALRPFKGKIFLNYYFLLKLNQN